MFFYGCVNFVKGGNTLHYIRKRKSYIPEGNACVFFYGMFAATWVPLSEAMNALRVFSAGKEALRSGDGHREGVAACVVVLLVVAQGRVDLGIRQGRRLAMVHADACHLG